MFDLNELPENDGPAGRASASLYSFATAGGRGAGGRATAKAPECDEDDEVVCEVGRVMDDEDEEEEEEEEEQEDDDEDVEEEEQPQVYYASGNSTKVVCRVLRDDHEIAKAPSQSFSSRLDNPPTICYPSNWQPSELATFDGSDEIDTDNEVTVAALDARAILDSQIVSRLDSAVSLVVSAEPSATSFGIAPRPEKNGQPSRKYSNFTNFHRSHPKWEGVVLEKRGNDRLEGDLNLDSRQPLLHSGLVSSRKGKRAREEGTHVAAADAVFKHKKHVRPTPALVVADAYDGAGPSLSMSLDQDAPAAENSSFSTPYKMSSKGEVSGREGTALSLGESPFPGFEPTAIVKRSPVRRSLASKSNLRLSMSASLKEESTDKVEGKFHAVPSVGEDQEGIESGLGLKKIEREVVLGDARRAQASERPVWQGELFVEGYEATDVTAYCSVDLQPSSKLWSLPQAVTVENIVKIQEFFAAAKRAHLVEPVMRLRLLNDGASDVRSFSSMVAILNAKMKGRAKDRSRLPEMLGWQTGSHDWGNGPPASTAGPDYVFIASPKLKQSKEVAERTSTKLYMLLGSSLELVSTVDRELGKKVFEGVDWSSLPQENYLFGFLCIYKEGNRFNELSRSGEVKAESSPPGVDASPTRETDFVSGLPLNKTKVVVDSAVDINRPEKVDVVQGTTTSEGEDAMARAEKDQERTEPAGIPPNTPKEQKGHSTDDSHETRPAEKTKGRKENLALRHYQSPTKDDGRIDRDRQRDRDRDVWGREREKDLRSPYKDVHRYSHRSGDKAELSKRDRLKDNREGDRFREKERSYRDSHRDLTDRSKSSRERIKELERQKERQRDREKDKEKPLRKRAWSAEPEKDSTDDLKRDLETEKGASSAKQEESEHQSLELSVKDNGKRTKVDREETHEQNPSSEVNTVQLETDVVAMTEPVNAVPLQDSRQAEGVGQGESNSAIVESLAEAETVSPVAKEIHNEGAIQVDEKDQNEKACEALPGSEEQTLTPPSSPTHAPAQNEADRTRPQTIIAASVNSVIAEERETVTDREADIVQETREPRLVEVAESRVVNDTDDNGTSQPEEHTIEGLSKDARETEQGKPGEQNVNDGGSEVQVREGDAERTEPSLPEPLYNPKEEMSDEVGMIDDVKPSKSKTLTVRVNNMYSQVQGQKSDDNEGSQDSGVSRRFLKDNPTPSIKKSVILGGEDQHGNLLLAESPSSATDNGSSPGLSAEVSFETLLQGCDKETKSWLVSKQSARYLAEEFGVRIASLEEVVHPKPDSQSKSQQGPVDIKVFLVTEKSTDTNEGKWFVNQAADVLQTLVARGVFTKCLWYQGPVQRYSSDHTPSIQGIVKRIKGEDGKNLEKIQEGTGVMIGIVLHGSSKNGTGNSARVIGLRLKGTKKKGIEEATKQAELLLSQVAVQVSKGTRAKHFGTQDAALLKLKVDFSNTTSPSSSILTPMHKDVFAAYSPVSPVATISPLGSFKHKLDEPSSTEATYTAAASAPIPVLPEPPTLNGNPTPANGGDFASQSHQSEDEQQPDKERRLPDLEVKYPRPLLVGNLPERASASMLRELFEDVLKVKFGLPSSYEGVSDMILDVRLSPEKSCAFVEFASDELLLEVLKLYADNKPAFFGLKLELGSMANLNKLERMFLAARTETSSKALEYGGDIMDSLKLSRSSSRVGRKGHKSEDHSLRVTALRSSPDSDVGVSQDRRFGGRDGSGSYVRVSGEKPSPLFLTELMRNSSARSLHTLFEDIIKKYINPSLGNFKGRATVMDVRFIPSRGCAFVDLATPELVDFMLDLHTRRPEVFLHMKMEIGRRPVPLGHGEEEPVVKRPSHLGRHALVEESHSYPSGKRARGYFPSTSPPPARRNEVADMDHDFTDDYEDEEEDERQPVASRKRRSDPERTVYADRLPDNASEGMIRRIFERVLRENMTDEQREVLGDNIITEVRYVPTKFCAFIVFVAEELTRLVLQLYNQNEEIFKNMRLKPHFHSRMEDLYRDDHHDREDAAPVHRVLSRDMSSTDRRSRRGMDDYQNGYSNAEPSDVVHRNRSSAAHRAVASTAFKEVDRRRSVYVDRIPERLPEPTVRDLFERAMRQHRHGYRSHTVSQVTFFRDKFDPEKLCAFVELESEDMVQDLLDTYIEDEDAFSGMRVRPAIKYGGH